MHTLLQIGVDHHLMSSRGFVLQRAGLQVVSGHPACLAGVLDSYFDLILLCHTISHAGAVQISRYVDLFWPATCLLCIAAEAEIYASAYDPVAYFPREEGPGALVHFVASLLSSRREQMPASASVAATDNILQMPSEARRHFTVRQLFQNSDLSASAP